MTGDTVLARPPPLEMPLIRITQAAGFGVEFDHRQHDKLKQPSDR